MFMFPERNKEETKETFEAPIQTPSQDSRITKLTKNLGLEGEYFGHANRLTEAIVTAGRRGRSEPKSLGGATQFFDPYIKNTYDANILGNSKNFREHPYIACKGPKDEFEIRYFFPMLWNDDLKIEGIVRIGHAAIYDRYKNTEGDFLDYVFSKQWGEAGFSKNIYIVNSTLKEGKQTLKKGSDSTYSRESPTKNLVTITRHYKNQTQTKTLPVYDIPIEDGSVFICLSDETYKKHVEEYPCDCKKGTTHISASLLYEIYKKSGDGHLVAHCAAGLGRTPFLFLSFFLLDHWDEIYGEGIDFAEQECYLIAYLRNFRGAAIHNKKQIRQAKENAKVLKAHEQALDHPSQRKNRSSLSFSALKAKIDPLLKAVIVEGFSFGEAISADSSFPMQCDKWVQQIKKNLRELDKNFDYLLNPDEKEAKKESNFIFEKASYKLFKDEVKSLISRCKKNIFSSNPRYIASHYDQYTIMQTILILIPNIDNSCPPLHEFELERNLHSLEKQLEKQNIPSTIIQDLAKLVNIGKRLIVINRIQRHFNQIEDYLKRDRDKTKDLKPLIAIKTWFNHYSAEMIQDASVQQLKVLALMAKNVSKIAYSIVSYEDDQSNYYSLLQINPGIEGLNEILISCSNTSLISNISNLNEIVNHSKTYYLQEKRTGFGELPSKSEEEKQTIKPFSPKSPALQYVLKTYFGDEISEIPVRISDHDLSQSRESSSPSSSSFSSSESSSSSYSTVIQETTGSSTSKIPTDEETVLQHENGDKPFVITTSSNVPTYSPLLHPEEVETEGWFATWNTLSFSRKCLYGLLNLIIFAAAVALIATGIGAVSGVGLLIALSTELASGISISFGLLAIVGSIWSYQQSLALAAKVAAGFCFIAGLMLLFTGVGAIFTPILLVTSYSVWMGFSIGIGLLTLYCDFKFARHTFLKDICNCGSFINVLDLDQAIIGAEASANLASTSHYSSNLIDNDNLFLVTPPPPQAFSSTGTTEGVVIDRDVRVPIDNNVDNNNALGLVIKTDR